MTIGERIRKIRYEIEPKKMSMAAFAQKIGVTSGAVSQWETGDRVPPKSTLLSISREFKINETWLLTGEGEMTDPPSDEQEIARVVEMLHTGNERIKKDIIIGLSKSKEESLVDILGHILRELHAHGIDLEFKDEAK